MPLTKYGQIGKYGELIKYSQMVINSSGKDRLYFRSGDYAKGIFKIAHTFNAQGQKEETKVDVNIALKIIKKSGDVTVFESNNYAFTLNENDPEIANLGEKHELYLLPNYSKYFIFTPIHKSEFLFNIDESKTRLFIDEELLEADEGRYHKKLQEGAAYNIRIENISNSLVKQHFVIDCPSIYNKFFIDSSEELMFKIPNQAYDHIISNTTNLEVRFNMFYDSFLNLEEYHIDNCEYTTSLTDQNYYITVLNNSNDLLELEIINQDTWQIDSNNYFAYIFSNNISSRYKFVAGESKTYIFEMDQKDYYLKIFDANFVAKSYSVTTLNTIRLYEVNLNKGDVIYFQFSKLGTYDYSALMSIYIKISMESLPEWKINGKITLNADAFKISRGESFSLYLIYQNQAMPVLEEYIKNIKLVKVEGDYIKIDNHAIIGKYDVIFAIKSILVNDDVTEIFYKEFVFQMNICIQKSVNNSVTAKCNDNGGIAINFNQTFLSAITVQIVNGNNVKTHFLSNPTSQIYGFDSSNPLITVKITSVWYKVKTDASGQAITSAELRNNLFGLNIKNLESSHVFASGNGTSTSPFRISSVKQFNNLKLYLTSNYYYLQTCGLNFTNTIPETCYSDFSGFYYGNGYAITGIYSTGVNNENFGGLFRSLIGAITNLVVELEIYFGSSYLYKLGGVVAINYGKLDNVLVME